jgi:hypothetical protein
LLNQVGTEAPAAEARWRAFAERQPIVRGLLSLDAFSRCWVEEEVLLDRVAELLSGGKQEAMRRLSAAWTKRNTKLFHVSCRRMAAYLARAAVDRESQPPRLGSTGPMKVVGDLARAVKGGAAPGRAARTALNERLDGYTQELMQGLIHDHGLEGESAGKIEQRVQDYQLRGGRAFDESSGAVAGAVVSGAIGGLAADVLSGGLSFGGGVIAGGILGALGGSALAKGYRLVAGDQEPYVRWTEAFLDTLCLQVALRYLAVAHYGRGRGRYRDLEQPAHWNEAMRRALEPIRPRLHSLWSLAETQGREALVRVESELDAILRDSLRQVLLEAYPPRS